MITMTMPGMDAVAARIGKRTHEAAMRATLSTATRLVGIIQSDLIPHMLDKNSGRPAIDTGAYRSSWKAKKEPNGASLAPDVPYASIIEFGARGANLKIGGMIRPLAEWARRHGMAKAGISPESIAWGIATNIIKRGGIFNGGKGMRVAEKAAKMARSLFRKEFRTELGNK